MSRKQPRKPPSPDTTEEKDIPDSGMKKVVDCDITGFNTSRLFHTFDLVTRGKGNIFESHEHDQVKARINLTREQAKQFITDDGGLPDFLKSLMKADDLGIASFKYTRPKHLANTQLKYSYIDTAQITIYYKKDIGLKIIKRGFEIIQNELKRLQVKPTKHMQRDVSYKKYKNNLSLRIDHVLTDIYVHPYWFELEPDLHQLYQDFQIAYFSQQDPVVIKLYRDAFTDAVKTSIVGWYTGNAEQMCPNDVAPGSRSDTKKKKQWDNAVKQQIFAKSLSNDPEKLHDYKLFLAMTKDSVLLMNALDAHIKSGGTCITAFAFLRENMTELFTFYRRWNNASDESSAADKKPIQVAFNLLLARHFTAGGKLLKTKAARQLASSRIAKFFSKREPGYSPHLFHERILTEPVEIGKEFLQNYGEAVI
ncbi:MAG: hypothetical protein P1U34_04945 [Coxiellaceae bacterium]|nr:hypothetical protein [Coxiellaceae bacterium]